MKMKFTSVKGCHFNLSLLTVVTAFFLTVSNLQAQTTPATALDFDGTNDYVQVNNFGTAPSSYTIEVWFKDEGGFGHQNLFGWLGNKNGKSQQILVGTQPNGTLRFGLFDYSTFQFFQLNGTTNVRDFQWHHVAVVTNGNTHSLIVDGVMQASGSSTASNTVENFVQYVRIGAQGVIGVDPAPTEYFNGMIDDVRVWNRALTPADLASSQNCQLSGNEPGLIAYYNFNQGFVGANNNTESTLLDRTGNGRNGSLTNFALNGSNSNWGAGNPAITINCNDLDNDGVLNEDDCAPLDASKWRTGNFYVDGDGDGYGAGTVQVLCYGNSTPQGYANTSGDCNDGDAAIKPGATELCDGIDNDCDGLIDEGFPDFDNDGIKDCMDTDDDNDGVPDNYDCDQFNNKNNKWLVCHNGNTICVAEPAVAAHLAHGDELGNCPATTRNEVQIESNPINDFKIFSAPNPAINVTGIRYELPVDCHVTIMLFDPMGRLINTPVNANRPAGKYVQVVDVSKLSAGIYFYQIKASGEARIFSRVEKLVITK